MIVRRSPSGTFIEIDPESRVMQASGVGIPFEFGGPGGFTGGVQEIAVNIWPFPADEGRFLVVPNPTIDTSDDWMLSGCCLSHARIVQYGVLDPPGSPPGTLGILVGVGFYCQPLADPVSVVFTATLDLAFVPIEVDSLEWSL